MDLIHALGYLAFTIYTRVRKGKKCDSNGLRPVQNWAGCKKAAQFLKLSDTKPSMSNNKRMPYRCYYRENSPSRKLWFNSNEENKDIPADDVRELLCEQGKILFLAYTLEHHLVRSLEIIPWNVPWNIPPKHPIKYLL